MGIPNCEGASGEWLTGCEAPDDCGFCRYGPQCQTFQTDSYCSGADENCSIYPTPETCDGEESNVLDMSELEKGLFFGDPSTALPGGEYYIGPAMSRENLLQSILNEQVPIGEGLSVNPYSQLSPEGQRAFVEEQMSKYRIGVDPTTISRPLSQEQINKERFGWIDEAKEYVSTLSEETPETTASIEPVESLTLPESIDNNYLLGNLSKIDYKEGEVMIAEDVHFLKKLLDSGLMNKEQYDRFTLNPFESLNLGKKQYGDNVLFQPQRGTSFINEGF